MNHEEIIHRISSVKCFGALIPIEYQSGEALVNVTIHQGKLYASTTWGRIWTVRDDVKGIEVSLLLSPQQAKVVVNGQVKPSSPREETVCRFIAEKIQGVSEVGYTTPYTEVWDTYTEWVEKNSIGIVVSRTAFGKFLKKYLSGYNSSSICGVRYINAVLKPRDNQTALPL